MFKSFSKVLVVTTMLLAFIGQTLAYTAMSCDMSNMLDENSMVMDHASMQHGMSMAADMIQMHDNTQVDDCCGIDCECPSNVCSSLSMLNAVTLSDRVPLRENSFLIINISVITSYQKSLYRPPILA
ncbi:hypothetical protein [Paraglaciecola sp.]|uniref:hypothetical protein n=1 Tax=Paraglaciecola sp. TaxID=1920173 RepID=UPI003264E954